MSRNLTAGMASAVQAAVVRPVLFYEGLFAASGSPSEQYLRLWSGYGQSSWDSKTWYGAGGLLQISPIEESARIEAPGFTVTLSGMPSTNQSLALNSGRKGFPGKLWLGLMDTAGALIADPYQLEEGLFDFTVTEDDGETCTIVAQYESRLIELFKPRIRRYTPEDQKLDYPTDLGFDYVDDLQDRQLIWGGPAALSSPVAVPYVRASKRNEQDGAPRRRGPGGDD